MVQRYVYSGSRIFTIISVQCYIEKVLCCKLVENSVLMFAKIHSDISKFQKKMKPKNIISGLKEIIWIEVDIDSIMLILTQQHARFAEVM